MYDVKLSLLIHCDLLQQLLDLSTSVLLGFDKRGLLRPNVRPGVTLLDADGETLNCWNNLWGDLVHLKAGRSFPSLYIKFH